MTIFELPLSVPVPPTPEGIARTRAIAGGLAERGATVVSGLAAGIDTAAHGATLAVACRTVAVIGTGLRRSYPVQNARLQQEIAERGLLLSQFRPDASPSKASFPMRNAVMGGYSLAAVVVEAAYRSGARVQARFALEQVDGFSSCVSAAVREGWLPTFSSSTSAWGSQPF
ncbi:DNA-processing protein DprA [Streptomyces sp. NPDC051576]|uniref:DNA-processing protein DprA n=1 Tax=Streptomyces sp. NPDC051576 TaxID=3155803 RepID=UPI00341684E5